MKWLHNYLPRFNQTDNIPRAIYTVVPISAPSKPMEPAMAPPITKPTRIPTAVSLSKSARW